MKAPNCLTLADLLRPVEAAKERLDEVRLAQRKSDEIAQLDGGPEFLGISRKGLFLIIVSSFEVMLKDILTIVLENFPEKMSRSQLQMDRVADAILTTELFNAKAGDTVRSVMYKDSQSILTYAADKIGGNIGDFSQAQIDSWVEIWETRNLLLHNNLTVNANYNAKAGPCRRVPSGTVGQRLPIDPTYLERCHSTVKYFTTEIEEQLRLSFGKYTRVAALRELWEFMMGNQTIVQFEDLWEIDDDEDAIRMIENEAIESCMSSSQSVFLQMWRDLFVGFGAPKYPRDFSLTCLDSNSRQKVATLLTVSWKFGVLANR
jgi:hypothetical protein